MASKIHTNRITDTCYEITDGKHAATAYLADGVWYSTAEWTLALETQHPSKEAAIASTVAKVQQRQQAA